MKYFVKMSSFFIIIITKFVVEHKRPIGENIDKKNDWLYQGIYLKCLLVTSTFGCISSSPVQL